MNASVSARPRRSPARPSAAEPAQHENQVQRDHLEPPLHSVGHAPGRVEDGLACLGHNRAIKRACCLPPIGRSVFSQASICRFFWRFSVSAGPIVLGRMQQLRCKMPGVAIADRLGWHWRFSGDDLIMRRQANARGEASEAHPCISCADTVWLAWPRHGGAVWRSADGLLRDHNQARPPVQRERAGAGLARHEPGAGQDRARHADHHGGGGHRQRLLLYLQHPRPDRLPHAQGEGPPGAGGVFRPDGLGRTASRSTASRTARCSTTSRTRRRATPRTKAC